MLPIFIYFQRKTSKVRKNYFEFIKCFSLTQMKTPLQFDEYYLQSELQLIIHIYKIREVFDVAITIGDLDIHENKEKLLQKLLDKILMDLDEDIDINKAIEQCCQIAQYLNLNKGYVLVKFCENLDNFSYINKIADVIYNSDSDTKTLCLISSLILNKIGTQKADLNGAGLNITQQFSVEDLTDFDTKIYVESLQMAVKLTTNSLLKCNSDDLCSSMEIFKWAQNSFFLLRRNVALSNKIFKFHYNFDIAPTFNTLRVMRETYNMYSRYAGQFSNPNTKYLNYFNRDIPFLTEVIIQLFL